MNIKSEQLFTNVYPTNTIGKIIQFPISRILISVLFIIPFLFLHNKIIGDMIAATNEPLHSFLTYIDTIGSVIAIFFFYLLYVKYIERRKCYELSLNNSAKEFSIGFIISLCLVGAMVLLMVVLGFYKVVDINPVKVIIDGFFFFGIGALIQEIFFRIIVFRLTEELLGSWIAFIVISIIFGFFHILNTNASIWTSIGLMLSDILLTAAFIYTRRIWMVWALHMSWNFFQDGIFGMPNSGITEFPSWIVSEISGAKWITGGSFGIEASYIAIFMSLLVGMIIFKRAIQKNQIVKPLWVRIKNITAVST